MTGRRIRASLAFGIAALALLDAGRAAAGPCEAAIAHAEYEHRIPHQLLRAMGMVEAGRPDGTIHPWALNVDGRAHLLKTRAEAEQLARVTAAAGRSFDGGCIQVSWRWHGYAFGRPEQLMDPLRNARYAAGMLADLRRRRGSWTEAVKHYHSGQAERQRTYVCKVWDTYAGLLGKQPAAESYCSAEAVQASVGTADTRGD